MVILWCHDEDAIAGLWSGEVVGWWRSWWRRWKVAATVAVVVVATVAMVRGAYRSPPELPAAEPERHLAT